MATDPEFIRKIGGYTIQRNIGTDPGVPTYWWWVVTSPANPPYDLAGFWPNLQDLLVAIQPQRKYK